MATQTIQLGGRRFPVVPQKHARLRHGLSGDDFRKVLSAQYGAEAYRLLCFLVPSMDPNSKVNRAHEQETGTNPGLPQYEFEGFVSQEAWESDDYDEDKDPGPTSDEIIGAFETVLNVNGAGRLGKLVDLISTGAKVAMSDMSTPDSLESPGENGASPSTSSGQSLPTPSEN